MSPAHELYTLIEAVGAAADAGRPAALATITATRGATFRRAGARMLVHADGRVVCELSGGCPQRDIVQRALRAIASSHPELARYNAESGLDVLMEMGCGGELDVLIEPLADARAAAFFGALADCLESRRDAVAATLFALGGEVVPPRRALWCDGAWCFDDLGDAALLDAVERAAASDNTRRAATLRLTASGAEADVLVERIEPPHALFAFGSSATARALLSAGGALGWRPTIVDSDPARLHEVDLPQGAHAVHAPPHRLRDAITFDRYSSAVVATHNLAQDIAWLDALRDAPVAYLGAIGSRERALRMKQDLSPPIANLHVPAGLDIGSETPQEIALAIAAEIIAVLNGRSGGTLRDGGGTLHP